LSFILNTPRSFQEDLAERFRHLRLFRNLKRATIAKMSGVPESSIKRFETSGEISLRSLLQLAHVLNALDEFDSLFCLPEAASLKEIEEREKMMEKVLSRKRGRQ